MGTQNLVQKEIQFGNQHITYSLKRSKRRTLGITVRPNRTVTVSAPLHLPLPLAESFVQKKLPWIAKKLNQFEEYQGFLPNYEFKDGEIHRYLGQEYRLKLVESKKGKVEKTKDQFIISGKTNPPAVEKNLQNFYRENLTEILSQLLSHWCPKINSNLQIPMFTIRKLKRKWGYCTRKGKLVFNQELIKTPYACIEYVAVHELCHLIEFNHSKRFYLLQARFLPDWKERKTTLEKSKL